MANGGWWPMNLFSRVKFQRIKSSIEGRGADGWAGQPQSHVGGRTGGAAAHREMESSALLGGLQPNTLISPCRQPHIVCRFPSPSSFSFWERKLLCTPSLKVLSFISLSLALILGSFPTGLEPKLSLLQLQSQSLLSSCNVGEQRASFLRRDATLSDAYRCWNAFLDPRPWILFHLLSTCLSIRYWVQVKSLWERKKDSSSGSIIVLRH